MKKKVKSFYKRLKMPHIYLEDVIAIDTILKEASGLDTKFTTEDYELSSIDELRNFPGNTNTIIHNLDIDSPWNDKSDVRVRLSESDAYVHGSDKTLTAEGAYKKVCEILERRQRPVFWSLTSWVSNIVTPALFGLSIGLMPLLLKKYGPIVGFGSPAACLVILLISVIYSRQSEKKFSTIELIRKSEKQSFLKRNKDQIMVGIIVGIVIALVSVIISYLSINRG